MKSLSSPSYLMSRHSVLLPSISRTRIPMYLPMPVGSASGRSSVPLFASDLNTSSNPTTPPASTAASRPILT